ncbi:MAG: prepilin-type N-terminal cleavage/methylation domain-containing protein [Planctomycetota bacterium]|nr:prepilin-type N-terminal cleavage/methylation domain-containing protein [Planctomycetota bacterium]
MKRRAFTLLEMTLAVAIASGLVLVAMMMFMSMERTDRLLGVRAEQGSDLAQVRLVMQRATLSFLMTPRATRPRATPTARARETGTEAEGEAEERLLTPRVILEADPRVAGIMMSRRDDPGVYAVQRLEAVLMDSPVPDSSRDLWRWVDGTTRRARRSADDVAKDERGASAAADADVEEAQAPVRAVRGAFEFWPQGSRGAQGDLEAIRALSGGPTETPILWELWWVPLPARGEYVDDPSPPSPVLGEAYQVAANIRYARWTFFDDRERKVAFEAATRQALPAYVELEIETGAGLRAKYMFETDGSYGPESARPPEAPPAPGEVARPSGAGGGGGFGSGAGGAGGGGTGGGTGGGKGGDKGGGKGGAK